MTTPGIPEEATRLLSLVGSMAMVTGAGSGIGRAIAIRFADMGADVVLIDIDETGNAQTRAEMKKRGREAISVKCDVSSATDCKRATETVIQQHRRVDILCNCAGIAIRKDVVELTEDEWDRALDVTLKGIYLLSHEVIPHMIRGGGGKIINIGSGWSLKGGPRAASYCAAKGGTVNLTRAMAIDYGKHRIRVNCICPGDVDTPMLHSERAQLGEDAQTFMREAANRPLARVGTPDDIATAALFLASPMSSWITGIALVVDGGGLA